MKALRYSWIVLFSAGAALAADEAGGEPAPSPRKEMKAHGEGGKGGKSKGERGRDMRRAMAEMWKKADTDGDGFLSLAEFSAMERPSRLPQAKREEIFNRIDKNGDGKVSPDEMPKVPPRRMPPLEQVDLDKDGRIVFAEFQKLGFVARLPEERQRGIFSRMDRDGDGALTPKDRPKSDGRDGKGPRRGNPMEMVREHDKDGDGSLSFEEFRTIPWVKDKGEDEQEDRFEEMDKNDDLKLDAADFPAPEKKKKVSKPEA